MRLGVQTHAISFPIPTDQRSTVSIASLTLVTTAHISSFSPSTLPALDKIVLVLRGSNFRQTSLAVCRLGAGSVGSMTIENSTLARCFLDASAYEGATQGANYDFSYSLDGKSWSQVNGGSITITSTN